jgi:hypothetical protein
VDIRLREALEESVRTACLHQGRHRSSARGETSAPTLCRCHP